VENFEDKRDPRAKTFGKHLTDLFKCMYQETSVS